MSWLSPKRRRTTGNLKTLPNGDQQPSSVQPPPATGSSNDDSVTVDSNAISLPTRPRIQPTAALHEKKIPGQSTAKRPTTLARPLSQPLMSTATLPSGDGTANDDDGNGDLFYAYARKVRGQADTSKGRRADQCVNCFLGKRPSIPLPSHLRQRCGSQRMVVSVAGALPRCLATFTTAIQLQGSRTLVEGMEEH